MSVGLVVLGLMLLMFLPVGIGLISNAKSAKNTKDLSVIANACRQYYMQFNHWPVQVSDLQPYFLGSGVNSQNYILNEQNNILHVFLNMDSVTVVKPRGIIARLDYR